VQPGYFGIVLAGGLPATVPIGTWFVVERLRDDDGALLDEGAAVFGGFTSSTHHLMQNVQPKSFNNAGASCLVPGNRVSSQVGNEVQVYRHYSAPSPVVRNLIGLCTHMKDEIPSGTEFTTALMNGEAHTYVALGAWAPQVSASSNLAHCAAVRFEA
jgi:hypothetical protein